MPSASAKAIPSAIAARLRPSTRLVASFARAAMPAAPTGTRCAEMAASRSSQPAGLPPTDQHQRLAAAHRVRGTGKRCLDIANALLRYEPLGTQRAADGELMWRLHVDSISRIANILIPPMAAKGDGRVVLIARRSQYGATKAALVAMARSWAGEVVASGVTVNVVSPAATQTPGLVDPSRKSEPPKVPPIGRLIRPEEVAALTGFLLSPAAAAITGQEILICGGASL
jgi:NAD(P)-dependent dehydrogenase (short-subunit alcohol dehydrogenase family)